MALKAITVQQYAALRGIVDSSVRRAIMKGYALPGVAKREKFGKAHILYVSNGWYFAHKKNSLKKVA